MNPSSVSSGFEAYSNISGGSGSAFTTVENDGQNQNDL